MNNFRRITAIAILSLLLLACNGGSPAESEAESPANTAQASGSYPFMGVAELDKFVAEGASQGKATMVLFWTTWCPSCKQEIPEMEALNKSHGDKVNIITISLDENVEALDDFFSNGKLDLPVYHGDDAIARRYQIEAIPTLVIFDKTGKSVFNRAGVFPHSMLEGMVKRYGQ